MAAVLCFLPLYLFVWWKILYWIRYLPGHQMLYNDICPLNACQLWYHQCDVRVWGYLYIFALTLQRSPSPVRTARWWWLPFQRQWPSFSSQWWCTSWLGGESGVWFAHFLPFPRPRGALMTVAHRVSWCGWFLILCLLPGSSNHCLTVSNEPANVSSPNHAAVVKKCYKHILRQL